MRLSSRKLVSLPLTTALLLVILGILVAVFAGSGVGHASAQGLDATPISESHPPEATQKSNHPSNAQVTLAEVTHSDSIDGLGGETSYFFQIDWDVENIDLGTPVENIRLVVWLEPVDTTPDFFAQRELSEFGSTGTITFNSNTSINDAMLQNCAHHRGVVKIDFAIYALSVHGGSRLTETQRVPVEIPCSMHVTPSKPWSPDKVCGPGNDLISINTQPDGVTVSDSGWIGTIRTITYTVASWVIVPPNFELEYTYIDEEECDAQLTLSYPTSLQALTPDYQMTVSATWAVPDAWPSMVSVEHDIIADFYTNGFDGFVGVSDLVGSHSVTSQWGEGGFVDLCIMNSGEIPVTFTSQLSFRRGIEQSQMMASHQETTTIDCTVALSPLEVAVKADVCGFVDERIIVPEQEGVVDYNISWDDSVATVTYEPASPYEIVGGPVTVTVDPCVAELMSDPIQIEMCGPNNDEIVIGDIPEGVSAQISDDWLDGEFSIELTAQPGWVLHADQRTSWELTDQDIACPVALTVQLVTSDGASIEGAPWQLYAPVAAQNVGTEPYAEGEVGADNQIVFEELIAGDYRLVVTAEGFEQIDTILTVADGEESQLIQLDVIAHQPAGTPIPKPTTEPTAEPTTVAVSGLPSTGTGSGGGFGILALAGMLAAMVLTVTGQRRASKP